MGRVAAETFSPRLRYERVLMANSHVLAPGQSAPPLVLTAHTGDLFDLHKQPKAERTLVVFFRFAGCPFCNVHVHVLIERSPELTRAGMKVVGVFGSSVASIRDRVARQQPTFPILADPDDTAHIAWGATHDSTLGMLDPRNTAAALQAVARRGTLGGRTDGKFVRMPADFVLDSDLRVHTAHYGRYAADHLSVDDVIAAK